MKVLVTGGAGYIGSHMTRLLQEKGCDVAVLDSLERGHRGLVPEVPFYNVDLKDCDATHEVLREFQPDAVMHFAAYAYVGEGEKNKDQYTANNIGGTLHLLKAMQSINCKKLVFSSTCATYGVPESLPITETTPQWPCNHYGWTKYMVEQYLSASSFQYVALRYFNVAGAAYDTGEWHEPETHLIPNVIHAALQGHVVTINGSDFPTKDGTCVRDYIHVKDLCEAHWLALQRRAPAQYNLGTGTGYSVMDIINEVEKVSGKKVPYEVGKRREGDPPALVASAEKAIIELGWQPKHTLHDIILSAWKWHTEVLPELRNK